MTPPLGRVIFPKPPPKLTRIVALEAPVVVVESSGGFVSISVRDDSVAPAVRHEDPYHGGDPVSGLAIVASVCRAWGSMPTPSGKAVWAVIGPENRL